VGSATGDISVVIPYYNRERYIDEAVQSVLGQTLRPLEIIIVNDCSRESSRRYLDRYAGVCKIVDLAENVGLAGARNAGIRVARGQFIAFLDDDDIWLPQKLELQRRHMDEHPECAIVHTVAWFFYQDQPDEYYKRFGPGSMTLAQAITNGFWAIIPTVLVRSEVIRAVAGFDVHFRECEDRDFIIRCCAAGYQVEGISEPLVRVRREGQGGLTARHWRIFRTDLRMCWKHKAHYVRAYGLRGILNFVLEKIQLPSSRTRYVDGVVRLLMRFVKIKYELRPGYKDPVLTSNRRLSASVSPWPPEGEGFRRRPVPVTPATNDISVIIPYYNRGKYIDETVQSVLAQTLEPLEIIIVNDCSQESSRRCLDRYAKTCKILDLTKNVGLAGARNAGIRVARGQYIALLDDDDIWLPEKLEVQRGYMEQHPECFLVHSAVWAFFSNKPEEFWTWCVPGSMTLAQSLTDLCWVCPSTMFFRTQDALAIGGFDPPFRQCEDRDFVIRCCAAGLRIHCLGEPLARLRRENHDRLTRHKWRILCTDFKLLWKHRRFYAGAYGMRGIVSYVLEKSRTATRETRYLDGAGRLVLRLVEPRYSLKKGFRDPILSETEEKLEGLAVSN
jgi:glycosyltransferase involved in cell wall biosynthesis